MKDLQYLTVVAVRKSWRGVVGLLLTCRVCPAAYSAGT